MMFAPIHTLRTIANTSARVRYSRGAQSQCPCLQSHTNDRQLYVVTHLMGTVLAEGLLSVMQLACQALHLLLKMSYFLPPLCLCSATTGVHRRPTSSAFSVDRHAIVGHTMQPSHGQCIKAATARLAATPVQLVHCDSCKNVFSAVVSILSPIAEQPVLL